ncbi:Hypothetical predicted protein [Cloeon dipterum]|uniref:Chitin-binding type-2 domain-containing protein n=1 Tax=Cloeon dipterum TaxID=197152 RepID=A0A8S1DUV2_9INSE|nr:Hypothetical predicted protein [Cloeon dipterum]
MNHLVWIFSVLLVSLCKAQIPERPSLGADYDDGTTLNQGGEVFDSDPLLYLNLGGSPGVDFPMYRKIPKTSFSCKNVKASGYYADMETNCQVFHLCENGEKLSFLCPNGTIFRQSRLTCDWWYKVDCGTSLEFYESSAEQLRQDRTTPKGEKSSRPRPLNFDDDRKVNNLESQVFAETGSLIISRQKSAKKFFESKSVPVTAEVTTVKSTGRFEVRKPKLNSPVQTTFGNKHSIYTPTVPPITSTTRSTTTSTTTTEPTTTEVPTTTYEITTYRESEQRSEGESLQGSHSSWFSSAATDPPVTESTIPELVNTLQNERRSDEGRAGRAQRLEDVPLVARPETLHSLATYFAADNKTRVELEKMVPEDQKILMEKIVREQKQLNPSLDTSDPNLRQLAKIFSKALTDYLHDPESFRETLSAVHPTQPPLPLVSDNLLLDEDKDEVLDFSDAPQTKPQRLVTTTPEPYTSTPFTPVTVRRNDVATKINEILDVPSGRRAPDGLFVTPSDFASPLDAETRGYLPSTSAASANLVDAIPTPTSFPTPKASHSTHPRTTPDPRLRRNQFQPS